MAAKLTGRIVVTTGALGLFLLMTVARADESEIPLNQLPKAVADSAKARFPGAVWKEAAKEEEDGKTSYEVSMTHDGHTLDVTFQPDGTLVLVETVVAEADLPAAVSKAIKGKYPGAKVDLVESVKKGPTVKAAVDYYEFHLTAADKTSVEIEVDGQGKILKSEAAAKEEGKD